MLPCKTCKYYRPKYGVCTHHLAANVDKWTGVITFDKAIEMRKEGGSCSTGQLHVLENNKMLLEFRKMSGPELLVKGGTTILFVSTLLIYHGM
jgi:hypothetical protein